ncbi:STAS domain-containing protein [Streptomyces sp. NPDC047079]|uniref:STAS domain-containing protein n=1 Tax=Streptomyces sp. NPDC047079 TaxID=3154607 RepID=UPI0033DE3CFE
MSQERHRVTVSVLGEIDIASAPPLERMLRELAAEGCGLLEVDLDGVEFMDSSIVKLLLRTLTYLEHEDACLRVRCSAPTHRRIFRLTSTDELLNVTASQPATAAPSQEAGSRHYLFDSRTSSMTLPRPREVCRTV